jgi:hypothetical protein
MAISEDAAAIAASNLVLAHVTAMQIQSTLSGSTDAKKAIAARIPELFRDYLDVVRQGGAPYPDRPDDAAGIQIF